MKQLFALFLLTALALCAASCADVEQEETVWTGTQEETTDSDNADSTKAIITTTYETREMYCDNNGKRIYGIAYIPQGVDGRAPLVIYSHGLGGTHSAGSAYARFLASHGIACYCYDFCGGSSSSRSDGLTTEMSIFTEKSDLAAVFSTVRQWDFVDDERIALFGTSQGGMVSAMFAADHESEIAKLVLFYPALSIPDDIRKRYSSVDEIPESTYYLYLTVGRIYFEYAFNYEPYADITRYTKDVLIVHGDRDSVIPIAYSQRAEREYRSATLYTVNGAGHGFGGDDMEYAANLMLDYLTKD